MQFMNKPGCNIYYTSTNNIIHTCVHTTQWTQNSRTIFVIKNNCYILFNTDNEKVKINSNVSRLDVLVNNNIVLIMSNIYQLVNTILNKS